MSLPGSARPSSVSRLLSSYTEVLPPGYCQCDDCGTVASVGLRLVRARAFEISRVHCGRARLQPGLLVSIYIYKLLSLTVKVTSKLLKTELIKYYY